MKRPLMAPPVAAPGAAMANGSPAAPSAPDGRGAGGPSGALPARRQHTHEEFSFVANAPADIAFPLFGAEREKAWAPGWEPQFVWPDIAADRPGMIFTLAHDNGKAVWVNTVFDPAARRIQYVYVIAEVVATVITIGLQPQGNTTNVHVVYERTALSPAADEIVRRMALDDGNAGPEWRRLIDDYLSRPA